LPQRHGGILGRWEAENAEKRTPRLTRQMANPDAEQFKRSRHAQHPDSLDLGRDLAAVTQRNRSDGEILPHPEGLPKPARGLGG